MSETYRSDLDQLIAGSPTPSWRTLAWLVIAVIIGAGVWASVAELDRIAVAQGVVAPKSRVRTVQHLEGGIVEKIMVSEGDRVKAGQPLVQLDLGVGGLNTNEIQVRLDSLRLERSRLQAEASQIDLHLPDEETARQPDLSDAERAAYKSRKREYETSLAVLRDQRSQKELEVDSIATRLSAARSRLEPIRGQLDIADKLAPSNLMPKMQALGITRDYKDVEGEIAALEASLPQAQSSLAEARQRELYERNRFRKDAAERLREVETEIARQVELQARATDRMNRTVVPSPIDGVVKTLSLNTIGGVIGAGEPIAEIVPSGEKLVIEAQVSPNDIGLIRVGQPATVKISTYDYLSYGTLEGNISQIAADATVDSEGKHFFRIIVEVARDHLEADGRRFPISAGMKADIDLLLGKRTVLRYLIEPVLKLRRESFRDR